MGISSFHTHTRLCKHASGDPVDYVRQAIAEGCTILGISDHAPYPEDSIWPESRMQVCEIGEYRIRLNEAKEYGQALSPETLSLVWGFECEWFPSYESWYRDFLIGELGAEYLVFGSHWVNDNGTFWYIPEYAKQHILRQYVDLTVAGLRSGLYAFLAHPDLFLAGYTRLTPDVKDACTDIIDAAVGLRIPLEINGLGLQRPKINGEHGLRAPYPVREFWEMASEAGATIICNSDAHRPEDVIRSTRNAISFANSLGITPIDTAVALGFVPEESKTNR